MPRSRGPVLTPSAISDKYALSRAVAHVQVSDQYTANRTVGDIAGVTPVLDGHRQPGGSACTQARAVRSSALPVVAALRGHDLDRVSTDPVQELLQRLGEALAECGEFIADPRRRGGLHSTRDEPIPHERTGFLTWQSFG